MPQKRLNIINLSQESSSNRSYHKTQHCPTHERKAKFERLWLMNKEQFNPLRNCMEALRLERTWNLLNKHTTLSNNSYCVDIGCGEGVFSRRLRDAGARVIALDIAENALKTFRKTGADGIELCQEAMPHTHLPDGAFNIVICTELIANLPQEEYRLFFAELSRITKPDGYLICSTPIDIDSDGATEKLRRLAESEFDIIEAVASYHALYLRLKRFIGASARYTKAWENQEYKRQQMINLKGIKRLWYLLNTSPFLIWFWYGCKPILKPIEAVLRYNRQMLLFLERICRFISDQNGISHYLFIAKVRPLPSIHSNEIPQERPKKKEIWD